MNAIHRMPRENRFPLMPELALDRYADEFQTFYVVDDRKIQGAPDFEKFAVDRFYIEKRLVQIKLGWNSKF